MQAEGRASRAEEAAEAEAMAEAIPEERAQYLVEAAEGWAAAGQPDHARALFEAAIADGGPVVGDARAFYAGFLFDTGQPEHALRQLTALRASHPTEPTTYVCAGEVVEEAGDLDGALRWFTAGLTRLYGDFDVQDALDDTALMQLLSGRRRVRQHLEQPADQWDELGAQAQAILIERLAGG